MSRDVDMDLPDHHSAEEILSDPQFRRARNELLGAMLSLYEHEPFLNRLLLEVGRNVLFVVVMCLDAAYDENERSTWPTLKYLKESMATFGLASPRRIADLVSRLIKTGYLKQVTSSADRRIRVLRPTEKMFAQDQDWLVSHYVPLQILFPSPGYRPIMSRDRVFQKHHRLVSRSLFPLAGQIMARNPTMMQFMTREAGMMIVIKLLQLAGPDGDLTQAISYSDIGARFGVSRTQVRKLLQDAEENGLVTVAEGRNLSVRLMPALICAFDRFIADTMVGHDIVFRLTERAIASSQGS